MRTGVADLRLLEALLPTFRLCCRLQSRYLRRVRDRLDFRASQTAYMLRPIHCAWVSAAWDCTFACLHFLSHNGSICHAACQSFFTTTATAPCTASTRPSAKGTWRSTHEVDAALCFVLTVFLAASCSAHIVATPFKAHMQLTPCRMDHIPKSAHTVPSTSPCRGL